MSKYFKAITEILPLVDQLVDVLTGANMKRQFYHTC